MYCPLENVLLPPVFVNVMLSLTFIPRRLNTVLVVVSGTGDPDIFGKIKVFMDCVVETCVFTASDKNSTWDNRLVVCCENAVLIKMSAESNA
jgi:hypothetical protein